MWGDYDFKRVRISFIEKVVFGGRENVLGRGGGLVMV